MLVLGYFKENGFRIQILEFKTDETFFIHDLYSQKVNYKSSWYNHLAKVINDSLLIVAIKTSYPRKHDYRRILAFDINHNFKLLWEIKTADFISGFAFSQKTPGYFFYTTYAYSNGLFFSHNIFYRAVQAKKGFKIILDTSFTDNPPPLPDSTAKDFSTDVYSYIVKCSLDGKVVSRMKVGTSFEHLERIEPVLEDSLFILHFKSRRFMKTGILIYSPVTEKLDTLVLTGDLNKTFLILHKKMYFQTIDENKNLLIEPFKKYNQKFTGLLARLPVIS